MNDPYPYAHAPVPSRHPTAPAALRRPHAAQPPSLRITALDHTRNPSLAGGALVQTPLSTTSLSTPFSTHPQSAYPHSPAGTMRAALSQNFRSHAGFSNTYNPQQWGPLSAASPQSSVAAHRFHSGPTYGPQPVGPDEPVASPPPPYSPRREPGAQDSPSNPTNLASPSDGISPETDSSRQSTPVSTALSTPDQFFSRGIPRGATDSASPVLPLTPSFPPPPPSANAPKTRSRASHKTHSGGLLSSLRIKTSNANISADAITTLQENTQQALAQATHNANNSNVLVAPSARRAASTGGIGIGSPSVRTHMGVESPAVADAGMPLPPPPPGPPPAATRAQSLNRITESPSSLAPTLPLRRRGPPGSGTVLDTVPPTPADWRDDQPSRPREASNSRPVVPLHIDTGSAVQNQHPSPEELVTVTSATPASIRRDSSAGGLLRSAAVRNRSAKGIRERRSESRHGKGRAGDESVVEEYAPRAPWDDQTSPTVKPANLVLSERSESVRRAPSGLSPRSGRGLRSLDGVAHKASSPPSNLSPPGLTSRSLNAITNLDREASLDGPSAQTNVRPSGTQQLSLPLRSADRPVSHILHMPVTEQCAQVALTPSNKNVERPISDLIALDSPTSFAARAQERHRKFAEKEAAAADNSERLDLFVQYVLAESKIRQEQYAATFEEQDIRVDDLIKGLFSAPSARASIVEARQDHPHEENSKRTSLASSEHGESTSQDESDTASRKFESPSSATTNSSGHRPNSGWTKDYVPCLSPIASMSIVTGQDEVESRGRAPSRWWEGSNSGDTGPSDGFKVLARSKRESKYMGVPKEARQSPAFYEPRASASASASQVRTTQSSGQYAYAPDEYPPEKVGWHDEETPSRIPPPPPPLPPTPASAPFTPNPRKLDVSRLVTLPPPYPRHHPAVNNSHPDLAEIRAVVRSLQEKIEVNSIRESYQSQIHIKRQRAASLQDHQRSLHQQDIEFRIAHDELSSSSYEEAESALEQKIFDSERELVKADFDMFQDSTVSPLHAIFTERVKLSTESMEQLSVRVFSDSQSHSPNLPQEEGDERPELLEILTMLKWLFDAREVCHRQLFDLLTERNDKYKAVVLLPYTQQKLDAKVRDAQAFFAQDAADRKKTFNQEVHQRAQAFLHVIDKTVSRGVEMQLDAFWSIAPQLRELLHKVPSGELPGHFEIRIPPEEFEETPSYHHHPLQYLYSLLGHCEKSSYQFIESQVNLLCLLHEIRNAVLVSRLRADRSEREVLESRSGTSTDREQQEHRQWDEWQRAEQAREEAKMTEDLKEKVGLVEGQWTEALGEELMAVRERVRGWLLEEDGWDDDQAVDV